VVLAFVIGSVVALPALKLTVEFLILLTLRVVGDHRLDHRHPVARQLPGPDQPADCGLSDTSLQHPRDWLIRRWS